MQPSRPTSSSWAIVLAIAVFAGTSRLPATPDAALPAPGRQAPAAKATVTIRAEVVDEVGKPLAGVCFARHPEDELTTQQVLAQPVAKSDAAGRLLATVTAGLGGPAGSRAALAAPGRTSVEVTLGVPLAGRIDLGTIVLRQAVRVRGLVRSSSGKPIAGARVTASDVLRAPHLNVTLAERCVSRTVTDARGRFTLIGVPVQGVTVRIEADGHEDHDLAHTNAYTPVVVQLRPRRTVAGTLAGADGRPATGTVEVYSTWSDRTDTVRTGADGHFTARLRHPGRFRLLATGNDQTLSRWSEVLDEPRQDLRIQLPAAVLGPGVPGVEVRAVAAATGAAVPAFRAALLWADPRIFKSNPAYLESNFRSFARPANAGRLTLPGPKSGQPGTGCVLIKAEGFAPCIVGGVTWEDGKAVRVDAKLAPESVVTGVVLDHATNEPLAGVRVAAVPDQQAWRNQATRPHVTTTDAKGRFRLPMLGAERYRLEATAAGRPVANSLVVKLGVGERKADVRVEMRRGATLQGKLTGAPLGAGWRVQLQEKVEQNVIMLPSSEDLRPADPTRRVVVGPDGRFTLTGLDRGRFELVLVVPTALGSLEIPVGAVIVGRQDLQQQFDLAKIGPVELRGKVAAAGAPLTPGRLMVCVEHEDRRNLNRGGFFILPWTSQVRGQCALVGRDGSYALPVRPGRHVVRLVDLATGVILFQSPKKLTVAAGKAAGYDVTAALTMVVVKLTPAGAGAGPDAVRLEVRTSFPDLLHRGQNVVVNRGVADFDRGVGVALQPAQREVTLVLPEGEVNLFARSGAYRVDPAKNRFQQQAVGRLTVHPRSGVVTRVEMKVE